MDAGDRERENKQQKRNVLEEKQRRVAELYADGIISKENYEARCDRLRIQLEMLAPPSADRLISTGKKIESFAQVWQMASMEDKRDIAQMVFEWIEIDVRKSRLRYVSPKRGFQMFFDKHPIMRKDEERGGYRVLHLP